jgi:hypothetical protein
VGESGPWNPDRREPSDKGERVRSFLDPEGREWEVVVGRESWGTVVAIFFRKRASEPPRQALLTVSSSDEGNRLLLAMTEEELQALLAASDPKPTE